MANNTYKNKGVYNGTTLIDLTGITVTPSTLAQGYTAVDASGAPIVGTMSGGGSAVDGNYLSYGLADGTLPLAGVAIVGSAVLVETVSEVGTAQVGYTLAG